MYLGERWYKALSVVVVGIDEYELESNGMNFDLVFDSRGRNEKWSDY